VQQFAKLAMDQVKKTACPAIQIIHIANHVKFYQFNFQEMLTLITISTEIFEDKLEIAIHFSKQINETLKASILENISIFANLTNTISTYNIRQNKTEVF
jgi:hypothetical protein